MPPSSEARVLVECQVCHIRYDVSARTHRDIKARRVQARCVMHRRRRPGSETAALRRFWLDRFSLDEIVDMATAIWPVRPSQRSLTMTGSGASEDQ